MVTVYGIKNCDSVKKALAWLNAQDIAYVLSDYKVTPPTHELLEAAADTLGWEALLNKRSTTFRTLTDDEKTNINSDKAMQLMLQYPTLIKRPLIQTHTGWLLGYNSDQYTQHFQQR